MKKMLLLCAGLLLAAGITSAEVVSTNIVGYVKTEGPTGGGYTILSPNFVSVLSENQTFSLDRITGVFSEWVDNITFLFPDGSYSEPFTWYEEDYFGSLGAQPGWYDPLYNYVGKTNLLAGTAVLITTDWDAEILVSGQVETDEIVVSYNEPGYYILGNCTPVPIALEKIRFTGLEEWVDNITLLSPDGTYSEPLTWYEEDYFGSLGAQAGWYDSLYNYVGETKILQPGEGVCLTTEASGISITFPAPVIN